MILIAIDYSALLSIMRNATGRSLVDFAFSADATFRSSLVLFGEGQSSNLFDSTLKLVAGLWKACVGIQRT